MTRRVRWYVPALVLLGCLLIQLAWLLSLPPFRGADEVDHAYRAASIVRGQLTPEVGQLANGRGEAVTVPSTLVSAAHDQCAGFSYMGTDNCRGHEAADGGRIVATAASRYNPVFYTLVGVPGRAFTGDASLYAMRMATGTLCCFFFLLGAWAITRWASSWWPLAAYFASLTPVAAFSTIVLAPNGVEICAALALWATLTGLARADVSSVVERTLLLAALPSASALAFVRTLGPLWLALVVGVVALLAGRNRVLAVWRRHRRVLWFAAAVVATSTAFGIGWSYLNETNSTEGSGHLSDPLGNTLAQLPAWYFQSLAAFPTRTNQAPTAVYGLTTIVLAALVVCGWLRGDRHVRRALIVSVVAAVAIPFAYTLATYSTAGLIWQGRYGLPLAGGIPVIAGFALDGWRLSRRNALVACSGGLIMLMVAQAVGAIDLLHDELGRRASTGDPGWWRPSSWLVALLMFLGWSAWAGAIAGWQPGDKRLSGRSESTWFGNLTSDTTSGSSRSRMNESSSVR